VYLSIHHISVTHMCLTNSESDKLKKRHMCFRRRADKIVQRK
jgi:hypothetical protein